MGGIRENTRLNERIGLGTTQLCFHKTTLLVPKQQPLPELPAIP